MKIFKLLVVFCSLLPFINRSQITAFSETFESGNSLTLVNGTQTNKWYRGTANQCNGVSALYISNNSSAYTYTNTSTSVVHAYFDVVIPAGSTSITLNFNRKLAGEANYDDLRIWSCVNSFAPTAGAQVTANANRVLLGTLQGVTTCATTTYNLPNTIAGTTRRIIFSWRNDGSAGTNPPALIDNITFTYVGASCIPPSTLVSSSIGSTTATISWTAASPAPSGGYQYYVSTSATNPAAGATPTGSSATTSVNLSSLNSSTQYYFWVRSNCGTENSSWVGSSNFTTGPPNNSCANATTLNCGETNIAGSTVGMTNVAHGIQTGCSVGGGISNYGVWYKFVGDGQSTTITVSPSGFDVEIDVVSGSCGSYSCVTNKDNGFSGTSESVTFTTSSGTTYYVYVAHYLAGSTTTGAFTISRSCITVPVNDNCNTAPTLTVNSGTSCTTPSNGTTLGANQSLVACAGTADDDVWFSFVATSTVQTITVTPGTMIDAVLQVYSGSCTGLTSLACVDATSGSSIETTDVSGLTIGTTYYVRVHSYGNGTGQGTFTVCATTPCSTPTDPGTISASVTTTVVNDGVTFTTTGNQGTINRIEWSTDNFVTLLGSQNNPANPFTIFLNGQVPSVQVRTRSKLGTCPASYTTPVTVTLISAPEFTYGTSSNDYISNVTLNTINNNSTYDLPLGYDSYQDFRTITTTLLRGETYTISASSPMTYGDYSGYSAWIDFNNNGIFEMTENIMQQGPGATMSETFTVPTDAAISTVTLRIISSWGETPSNDAYFSAGYLWGEIEEYTINIDLALPLELYNFDGISMGKDNYIYWITASEQNTSHFNLQKSRDGETWSTISTLAASGNSNTIIEYSVSDYNVEQIINYYRLQQYDNDGVYETYGPISINNTKNSKIIVKYINLNGQEIDPTKLKFMTVYFEIYSDGSIRRVLR